MKIIEIHEYSAFLTLEKMWKDILQVSDYHTVFSTWAWLSIWWKHFGRDKRLLLLLAEEDGEIVGIAPLMYSVHRAFGLRQGRIEFIGTRELANARFIGTPDSDYNDFIVKEKNEECIKLFIDYLNNLREKWDCIDLMDIPESSPSLKLLGKTSGCVKPVHECPYISLPKSYDAFLSSLNYKKRKNIRRASRSLEKDFKVDFVDCSGTQYFAEGIESLIELHQRRWESKGFCGVFGDQRSRSFHMDVARSFAEKGWLGLYLLKVFDHPVAAHYGFKYRSKFYSYVTGFDPRYSKYGVGSLLAANIIANCIQDGLVEFDFLRGTEEYKERWNTTSRWNQRVVIPRKNFLSDFKSLLYEEYWRQGNRIKYLLRIQ